MVKPAKMTSDEALKVATSKLTTKQREFVKQLAENKKISGTEAAERAYSLSNRQTAAVVAHENLRKPNIISALDQYTELAESTLTTTIRDWGKSQHTRKREIAQQAAMYVHDKVHGKATQRVEQQSVSVNIEVDLT